MSSCRSAPPFAVMFVTPDPGCAAGAGQLAQTERLVEAALLGGVDAVQLRAKALSAGPLLALATRCAELCAAHGAKLVVNDRLDVAMAAGADGVQLGESGLPPGTAVALCRHWAPSGRRPLIGVSVHDRAGAERAAGAGVDYLIFGHIYPSRSKPGLPPAGLPKLSAAAQAAGPTPVYAIGGVSAARTMEIWEAGAAGIAVIGAIAQASDPAEAAAELVAAWNEAVRCGARP